ncbi:hypothetical protein ARMSODRAFT_1022720 [Armillaria solidipes]|uniref:Ribonuclease H1 N-terminal domain-containing protein n=1 Tax=Armillaria solidipes TaxID=1076256 RepID=A0A2H3BG49_9AGAR|nr:hypothetical protein ARMSODRAFT_1022720 [Armillaria solidipes]
MSDITVDAHATQLSVSVACASPDVASVLTPSVPSSPATAPPNSSPLSSGGSLLSINGEDSDVEMVVGSNIVTDTEAASIRALVTPRDDSPWVAGKKFYEIPPQPITTSNVVSSNKWYVVFKGLWVGIVTSSNMASSATDGVSTASKRGFKSQQAAVDAFNEALDDGDVAILTK